MIKRDSFVANTVTLSVGIGLSQLIIFGAQLLLRRIYTPEEFGAFDVYFNMLAILAGVVALRYEMAIVLPEGNGRASNLLVAVFFLSLINSALIFSVLLLFRGGIIRLLNFPVEYAAWLNILPVTIFLFGTFQGINYWLIRQKKFQLSSMNKVIRRTFESGGQVSLGFTGSSFGLVIGDMLGYLSVNMIGLYQVFRNKFTLEGISRSGMVEVLRRYREFPKFNSIPVLLNSFCTALPFLIINKFFGGEITGYFGLSKMVLAIPIALISAAVSQVLLQRVTEMRNSGRSLRKELFRIFIVLFSLAVFEVIILSAWGYEILSFLFGSTWQTSGEFIQILVYASAVNFIVSPISMLFVALERIKLQAVWQVCYFVLILALYLFKDSMIERFLFIYVLIDIVSYVACLILIIKIIGDYELKHRQTLPDKN